MIWTSLLLALQTLRRRLLRSFLTVLGVVIGVFSVVTMVTLGGGATVAVRNSIAALGSDILQIRPGQSAGPGGGGSGEAAPPFKLADLDAIREQIGGVVSVAGQVQTSATAVRNAQNWSTSVTGTTDDYFRAQKLVLSSGRVFSKGEETSGAAVCVIGATIVKNLFQATPPVGESFRVKDVSCQVVGVLAVRGQSGFGGDQDDTVIMPIKAVQRRMTGSQDVSAILVGVDPAFDSASIQRSLVSLLRERRFLQADQADNFSVLDAKQISDTISGTVSILTFLVGAVAGISLLVGGIGIMNIMLVSVTERTREIGIRLAIGALGRDVLTQFLVEAVTLSCIGGWLGLVLSLLVTLVVAPIMGAPFLFNPGINLLSFGFSALIGVVFGYVPARRAARLNPIEALRYD